MREISLLIICFFTIGITKAQQKAVTETGDQVILYDDGVWKYQDENQQLERKIRINPKKFERDENSTFLLKSKNLNIGYYLNPKQWSFNKSIENPDAEYELALKGEDLYGLIITERVEIPLETLRSIALENGKTIVPDLKIVNQEYRTVNGLKVLQIRMDGNMQGIKITYYGYYYSNDKGTVQFITYTSQNLLDSYLPEIEKLLNGIVELN
ncbi:hypothetical protein ACFSQ0_10850 [Mesonia sediminis]|uniref:Uncharacterized protein n=1 Tax=Mesonia sediminis TaxID=1703946 RepID=A0ABW5SH71_9FLAO